MVRLPLLVLLASSLALPQSPLERGHALLAAGRPVDAETELARAVEASPGDAPAWRLLGLARIAARRLPQAEPALLRACQLESPPVDSCYYLARNRHALAQYEPAREAFDLALRAAPSAQVHRAAGLNHLALGRSADAELHLRRAVALTRFSPDTPSADPRIDLGAFLFREGRVPEAIQILESAVESVPASHRAHLELGRVRLQQGQLAPAVRHLEQAARYNPAEPNARFLLARAYQRLGRDTDAARALAAAEALRVSQQP